MLHLCSNFVPKPSQPQTPLPLHSLELYFHSQLTLTTYHSSTLGLKFYVQFYVKLYSLPPSQLQHLFKVQPIFLHRPFSNKQCQSTALNLFRILSDWKLLNLNSPVFTSNLLPRLELETATPLYLKWVTRCFPKIENPNILFKIFTHCLQYHCPDALNKGNSFIFITY